MKPLRLILASPFLLFLYLYRFLLSPLLHALTGFLGGGCRFQPTCSRYAIEALHTQPLPKALWLIVRRVGRCHPWGGEGYDPVPGPTPDPARDHGRGNVPGKGKEERR